MGLLKEQKQGSPYRGIPVEEKDISSSITSVTGETAAFSYSNAGVRTADAGQLAGVAVEAVLAYDNIRNSQGKMQGSKGDTSLSFTSTAFTSEVQVDTAIFEAADDLSWANRLTFITGGGNGAVAAFTNGQYCVDYAKGILYGVKASTQTSLTSTAYKVNADVIGLVTIAANSSVNVNQIGGTAVAAGNGVAGAGALRVCIASDNTAFSVNATLQAGSALVGKVGLDQTTPGTTNAVALAQIGSTTVLGGNGLAGAGALRVCIASDNTVFGINTAQINGVTPLMGNGVAGTGALRVCIASDNTVFGINVSQINGVTPLMGNGVAGTGALRVCIASDNTAFSVNAAQSGTWTVQPGNTANTTAWLVQATPSAAAAAAPTNATSVAYEASRVVKASAGNLYSITGYNSKTADQFIQVHDAASLPADTAVPKVILIARASSNFSWSPGGNLPRAFGTGIVVSNSSTGATKTIGAADCWFDIQFA